MHQVQSVRWRKEKPFIQASPARYALEPKSATDKRIYIRRKLDTADTAMMQKTSLTYIHTYISTKRDTTIKQVKRDTLYKSSNAFDMHTCILTYKTNKTNSHQNDGLVLLKQRAWHTYIRTYTENKTTLSMKEEETHKNE